MMRLEVDREDLSTTRIEDHRQQPLDDGQIRVRIDLFALTANNITYGVAGDKIGYWQFFPADDSWGVIPVWGVGVVEETRHGDVKTGERLYGYFPMGDSLVITPGKLSPARLVDTAPHRASLPPVYNAYQRLTADTAYDPASDPARTALYPLYATSFCLYDFFADNNWFDAQRVLVLSASSKTAIGCALAFTEDDNAPTISAMTSAGNRDWVSSLALYDTVHTYDDIQSVDADTPTAIIDMSGNGAVLGSLHKHLGDQMRFTSNVGLTHWSDNTMGPDYIRERSAMFFAPGHIQKRSREWSPGVFEQRSGAFWARAAKKSEAFLTYKTVSGLEAMRAQYLDLLNGRTAPQTVLIIKP